MTAALTTPTAMTAALTAAHGFAVARQSPAAAVQMPIAAVRNRAAAGQLSQGPPGVWKPRRPMGAAPQQRVV